MQNKFITLLVSLIISPLLVAPTAFAQSTPPAPQNFSSNNITVPQQAGTLQVDLPRVYFVKGTLWADIQIKNDTQNDIGDIMPAIKVLSPSGPTTTLTAAGQVNAISPGFLVAYQDYDFFTIKKGETITKKVEYKMGSGFENGVYRLSVQIKGTDNQIIGYQTQTFNLVGDGRFAKIDPASCKVQIGSETYALSDGPIAKKGSLASLVCDIENPTGGAIQARSRIQYAVNSISANPTSEITVGEPNQTVPLSPKQTRAVSFKIPEVEKPQVYQGLLYLVDEKGNQISAMIDFRWTVPGASATIRSVESEKDSYQSGSKAIIRVQVDPSADLAWTGPGEGTNLEDASLVVNIVDPNKTSCGSATTPLPKTSEDPAWPLQKVSVDIQKNCPSFIVQAEIKNAGQTLAEAKKGYGGLVNNPQEGSEAEQAKSNTWIWVIVGVVLAILAGVAFFIYKKRKNQTKPPSSQPLAPPSTPSPVATGLVVMIALAGIFGAGNVIADTVKTAVDSPIGNETVYGRDLLQERRYFWANVSNFATTTASASATTTGGRSTISISQNCETGTLYLYGYGNDRFCGNFEPGLVARVFIDGQPVNITSVQSPDSVETHSTNEFNLINRGPGDLRTGTATLSIPPALQTTGSHKIDVQVGAAGIHRMSDGRRLYRSTYLSDVESCDKRGEPCYALISTSYACNRCPAGQTKPYYVCDPTSKACKPIDECGVSTCTPGQNNCENCDNPNEVKPYLSCVNNACVPSQACGTPSCNTNADCCPAGMVYDAEQDKCLPPPACNISCASDTYCQTAEGGCTSCLPNDTNTGTVCRPPAACNVACANDAQCQKAGDGCVACVSGSCQIPPACGNSCTSKAQCTGAKDGCTECLEGTCTDYNDNMCKCDGIVSELNYPNPFKFEAFGKVEGGDIAKAEIADVTFRLTKDNIVVARSEPITPTVVENTGTKMRYKADWQTPPPALDKNATYRVFADVRCKPKKITAADASQTSSPAPKPVAIASHPPKGLEFALNGINNLFGNADQVKSVTDKILAMFSTSTVNAQSNLQLETLKFVKVMDTDNCRFVMFKFDETLF